MFPGFGRLRHDEQQDPSFTHNAARRYTLIADLAREGAAILLISSELPEGLNLSMWMIVLREGRPMGKFPRSDANREALMRLMAGVASATA